MRCLLCQIEASGLGSQISGTGTTSRRCASAAVPPRLRTHRRVRRSTVGDDGPTRSVLLSWFSCSSEGSPVMAGSVPLTTILVTYANQKSAPRARRPFRDLGLDVSSEVGIAPKGGGYQEDHRRNRYHRLARCCSPRTQCGHGAGRSSLGSEHPVDSGARGLGSGRGRVAGSRRHQERLVPLGPTRSLDRRSTRHSLYLTSAEDAHRRVGHGGHP